MKAKFKSFFKNIHITKLQLITVALCYFLCFSLFLGIVVIWNSMSNAPTEQSIVASDKPNNTSGRWTDSGRYSIEWYTSTDKATYGDGSASNPYKISSAEDLAGLSWLVYTKGQSGNSLKTSDYSGNYIFQDKYFKQTVNINLSEYYWQPIGIAYTRDGTSRSNYFSGNYNGGNHTVSGIFTPAGTDNDGCSYQGLFGWVSSSSSSYTVTIQNIGIINSVIQGSYSVGGVLGYADRATVINCYNTGFVRGSGSYVGGVVGYASSVTITNCYNTGSVSGFRYVGGVVGYADASSDAITITNCYNTGDVTNTSTSVSYVGGVVGYADASSSGAITITNCYYGGVTGQLGRYGTYLSDITRRAKTLSWYTTESNWNSTHPWDFEDIWVLDSGHNDGYPSFMLGYWIEDSNYYSIEWYTSSDKATYGDGSASNPYKISSAEDLAGLSWLVYTKGQSSNPLKTSDYSGNYIFRGKYFIQTEDIDLSAHVWQPIGIAYTRDGTSRSNYFAGSYDGGNHTVSDIFTPAGTGNGYSYQGLFGYVSSSSSSYTVTIQNIGIINSVIQGSNYVGGVVGRAYTGVNSSFITITNCYNAGDVTSTAAGDSYVGGVVGYANARYSSSFITITNCYNTGAVTGSGDYVGGVVGRAYASSGAITITNCYNAGDVTSTAASDYFSVGGVVGDASSNVTITNCYNTGAVSGDSYVGGVVGVVSSSVTITITNCYNTGDVTGSGNHVGGVVGYASVSSNVTITITNCYNTGAITGSGNHVGGIVGYAGASSNAITITNCYNTGDVRGSGDFVGGVVGEASSNVIITNCYNTGDVSGNRVGGVVGIVRRSSSSVIITITNCYNTGAVSGSYRGGVVGIVSPSVTINITKCYYGGGVTGQLGSYGTYLSDITRRAKTLSWYTTESSNWNLTWPWDFKTVWVLDPTRNDGYPSFMIDYWIKDSSYYSIEWYTSTDKATYGDGSVSNPYKIASAQDLAGLSWLVYTKGEAESPLKATDYSGNYIFQNKYFIQTEDIDLSAHVWLPIGIPYTRDGTSGSNYFSGSYDGGYNTVSGIFMPVRTDLANCYQGLFGYVSSSSSSYPVTIQNIGIINSNIQGYQNVGGFVGYADASSGAITISNCYNAGFVTGFGDYVGGIVGHADASSNVTITNCYNTGTVTGSGFYVGGIVGYANASSDAITITNCYNTGTVSGSGNYVGGVVGYAGSNTNLANCYNLSSISGATDVGGIVGVANFNTIVTNCYNEGNINGATEVGGIVGLFSVSGTTEAGIFKSANFGDIIVTGNSGCAGGLIGVVRIGSSSDVFKMTNCYANCSINVSGTGVNVGGLVGILGGDYSNYQKVKIEFCSADLEIMISNGSITSQGAFYSANGKINVENSYSLLTKGGVVSKTISSVRAQMDDNFGYILNFKEGKPIPLGIFYITDLATKTGIVDRINSL